ncbi:MAG: type VI secretion system baseplate subunit TssE [Candidatus Accumulibacter sp.]|jgi:type VI secretion system lysozyme-like protein|nr:type VI secretion system baseplate subunit TssE [Accumulibacter sp.]
MARLRLFERMRLMNLDPDHARKILHSEEALLRSICDYVARLLNSREGSTLMDPKFGMPDFTHAGSGFSSDDEPLLRSRIVEFICRDEPRLTDVQVAFLPRDETHMALSFSISGRLRGDSPHHVPVCLYSDVTQQGKIDVRL